MATNIHEFQSEFKGGVRPNLFQCRVFPPSRKIMGVRGFEFHCKGTSMPASTVGNIPVPYHGRQLMVPGDRTFADWTVTVFNDDGMKIRGYFEEWMAAIQDHQNPTTTLPISPYGTADIIQLDRTGKEMRTYSITSMYPTEVAAIDLSWDSNDAVEEYAVTFAVNNYLFGDGSVTTTSGKSSRGSLGVKIDTDGNFGIEGAFEMLRKL